MEENARPYFSGKWHLGDKPEAYPTEHGFDEMKEFAAYYPGVYTYSDTSTWFHPWFLRTMPSSRRCTSAWSTCTSGKALPENLLRRLQKSRGITCLRLMSARPTLPSSTSRPMRTVVSHSSWT